MKPISGRVAITGFTELLHEAAKGLDGYMAAVAIQAKGERLRHKRFPVGQAKAMADLIAHWAAEPDQGVFSCLEVFRSADGGRSWGRIDDVLSSLGLVVEVDIDTGKTAKLVIPPTIKICTSAEPHAKCHHVYLWPPDSRPSVADVNRIAKLLHEVSGGDSATGTVPHLYPYPGTYNLPNESRLARGRPPEPQATTLHITGKPIDPTELERLLLAAQPGRELVRHTLTDAGALEPSVKAALDERDEAEVRSHPNGVGDRYVSGKKSLIQDIARARKKVALHDKGTVDVRPNEQWHEDQTGLSCQFLRHRDGTIFCALKEGNDSPLVPLCSPIRVIGRTASSDLEWGLIVELEAPDKTVRQLTIPAADLLVTTGDRNPLQLLASAGVQFLSPKHKGMVRDLLMTADPQSIMRSVTTPGWHGTNFALPSGVVSAGAEGRYLWSGDERDKEAFAPGGELLQWQTKVAAPAAHSHLALFGLCTGFVGPLLRPLNCAEGFGFHFHGPSSTGKTTVADISASVWGHPDRFVKTWRGTANGIEATAASRNDILLVLDELKQVDPREADQCAYMLAQGKGKQRASRSGGQRKIHEWRVPFLSTGEVGMADYLKGAPGRRALAGQQVRVLDIPVQVGNASSPASRMLQRRRLSLTR